MKPSISQTPGNDCTPSHQIISCVIPIFPPPHHHHHLPALLEPLWKGRSCSSAKEERTVGTGVCLDGGMHCVHSHLHNDALQRLAVIAVLGSGQEGFSRGFGVGRRKEGG